MKFSDITAEQQISVRLKVEKQCPKATQDIAVNLANRGKAIKTAMYGPLNPSEPNNDYWGKLAKEWDVDTTSAKKQRCGNCSLFIQTPSMKDCINKGVTGGERQDEWEAIDSAGELGYCEAFDFKCASKRTCRAWVAGGPIINAKGNGVGTEEKSLGRTLGTILEVTTPNKPSKDGDGDGFIVNPKTGKDNIPFKQNFKKQDSKKLKDAIVKSSPKMMQVKTKPWAAGDEGHAKLMLELGASKKEIKLATSQEMPLEAYASTHIAAGNCGQASIDVGAFLIREGLAKEGEVFLREVGEPWYGNYEGTHFVTHVGPKDSDDAIIIDFTLRQFDADEDFPWIGTVREYRAQGYENKASLEDGVDRPQMGDESFDKILASGKVVYPWDKPGFKGDEDLK